VKGFDGWCGESADSEGNLFDGRLRVFRFLEYEYGTFGECEFAGEEKSDGACSGDDYVIHEGKIHEWCTAALVQTRQKDLQKKHLDKCMRGYGKPYNAGIRLIVF